MDVNYPIYYETTISKPLNVAGFSYSLDRLPGRKVRQLQEKWQFPSDHLPVGATIDGFHIATWNILNTNYLDWIERNGQGLCRSQIMQENCDVDRSGLTLRDRHVIDCILEMIDHPTHPRSVIALQECSDVVVAALKSGLPERIRLIPSLDGDLLDEEVLLYDQTVFDFVKEESSTSTDSYPSAPGRRIMNTVLVHKKSLVKYQFINAHVPGDPNLPGREEFARHVMSRHVVSRHVMSRQAMSHLATVKTIALGDMNFNPREMEDAFKKASVALGIDNPFQTLTTYYTNVGPDLTAKAIDHIFIEPKQIRASSNTPEEVLFDLQKMVDLLH